MTLATMRSYVWKSNGDVILHYRLKGNLEGDKDEAASNSPSPMVVGEWDKSLVATTTTTLAGDGIASV